MVLHFLDCELDTERCELRRAGERVPLRAKVFQLLLYLIEQRHRRVPKDELLETIWPGRVIAEATLNSCVKALRQAVGDDGQRQQVIQTVRGLGYRFVAEVREAQVDTVPSPSSDSEQASVPAPLPPKSEAYPLGKEYKQVSVLCGGVLEASALAQRLDPEAMDRLMDDFYALAEQAIGAFEGVIVERHGGGFLALFGAPQAHEDHARRAVLAALELLHKISRYEGLINDTALTISLGLHTGPVVVGGLAQTPQQIYTALGSTTDTAAQLQQHAAPGALLISAAVYRLVATEVQAEAQGAIDGDKDLTVYAVQGIRRRLAGVPQRRPSSRFVGRERELALLQQGVEQVASGQGRVIGISGEPGIGKSRLLYEFRRRLSVPYFEGRCLSYGKTSPYLPLLDILRQCCGIGVQDNAEEITAKLTQTLSQLEMTTPDAQPLLLPLLTVKAGNIDWDPQQRRAQTFAYLRQLLQRQALPGVVAVEDAHWIDATSDDWLAELVARLAGLPLLLVVTYRPGYRPAWLETSIATQLALPPLPLNDSQRLVQSLAAAEYANAEQIGRIIATAQGNPFFLEELSWALSQADIRPTQSLLPDTVQAVVAARIDRLTPAPKQLLQTAAVIGTGVPLALLKCHVPLSEETLAHSLDQLQNAEFLYETQVSPTSYTFKHALTREVAYQSLLRTTRQRLHRQIAETLAGASSAELIAAPELIAHHYTEAGLLEPAIDYWQQAAQQASQRSALVEAIGHLQTALALLAALPNHNTDEWLARELVLQLELGVLLQVVKGPGSAETERTYARAQRLSQQVDNAGQRFAVLWGSWRMHNARGEYNTAFRIAEALLELAEHEKQPYLLLEARHALWTITGSLGHFNAAQNHIVEGINLSASGTLAGLVPHGGHDPVVCALGTAVVVTWVLGHPEQSEQYVHRTLKLAAELNHQPSLAQGLVDLIDYYQLRQEPVPLRVQAERLIECAAEYGFEMPYARGEFSLGWCLVRQGDGDTGIAKMRQALKDLTQTGYMRGSPYLRALFAESCIAAGRLEEGLASLNDALAIIDSVGAEFWLLAETYRLAGDILLSQPNTDQAQAEDYLQKAIALARKQEAKSFELRAATSLSEYWLRQGKHQQARKLLAPIYDWFSEGFETADLRKAKALLDIK